MNNKQDNSQRDGKALASRSITKARSIIADIYSLMGKHKYADWELNKATDAMYKFINEVESR